MRKEIVCLPSELHCEILKRNEAQELSEKAEIHRAFQLVQLRGNQLNEDELCAYARLLDDELKIRIANLEKATPRVLDAVARSSFCCWKARCIVGRNVLTWDSTLMFLAGDHDWRVRRVVALVKRHLPSEVLEVFADEPCERVKNILWKREDLSPEFMKKMLLLK